MRTASGPSYEVISATRVASPRASATATRTATASLLFYEGDLLEVFHDRCNVAGNFGHGYSETKYNNRFNSLQMYAYGLGNDIPEFSSESTGHGIQSLSSAGMDMRQRGVESNQTLSLPTRCALGFE